MLLRWSCLCVTAQKCVKSYGSLSSTLQHYGSCAVEVLTLCLCCGIHDPHDFVDHRGCLLRPMLHRPPLTSGNRDQRFQPPHIMAFLGIMMMSMLMLIPLGCLRVPVRESWVMARLKRIRLLRLCLWVVGMVMWMLVLRVWVVVGWWMLVVMGGWRLLLLREVRLIARVSSHYGFGFWDCYCRCRRCLGG